MISVMGKKKAKKNSSAGSTWSYVDFTKSSKSMMRSRRNAIDFGWELANGSS